MKVLVYSILALTLSIGFSTMASAKTRVAVSTFKDKSADSRCKIRWFSRTQLGSGFQEQLITKLQETRRFAIQERTNLKKMYDEEHNLVNSDRRYSPRKNKFKAAHYSITGAVTAFELCEQGGGGDVDVGGLFGFKKTGLKLGGGVSKARVALDVRIVDVEKGEIVDSFVVEGTASSAKFKLKGDYKGSRFGSNAFGNTPLGEATREALAKAATKIDDIIPDRKDDPRNVAEEENSQDEAMAKSSRSGQSGRDSRGRSSKLTTQTKHLCTTRFNDIWSGCKIIKRSKTGKRIMVLKMEASKKQTVKPQDIRVITPVSEVEIGQDVLMTCNLEETPCSWERKYGYAQCVVVDSMDSDVIVTCKGKEYQVGLDNLSKIKKLSVKKKSKKKVAKK